MKKAFTLIELLIVVVVIAILASITFKIAGIGSSSEARSKTLERIQRLENAISGYYAAFGSYPPVQLEGRSRNFYYAVNKSGIQQTSHKPESTIDLTTSEGWHSVEAACRAQPVATEFPYSKEFQDYVDYVSTTLTQLHNDGVEGYENPLLAQHFDGIREIGQLSPKQGYIEWTRLQLFKFGLLSYLLPRYLVMMGHDIHEIYDDFKQWNNNNECPAKFEDGVQYDDWRHINTDLGEESWKIKLLPSQSITARWLVNFQDSLACNTSMKVYGVDIKSNSETDYAGLSIHNPNPKVYSSGDSQGGEDSGATQLYALNEITMRDGWGRDLYYYSPPPYQTYRIWSAGANGKTFPPWVSPEELKSGQLSRYADLIRSWIADDLVHMSN